MHLRSRRHLQSGDRSKRRCIYIAESIFKVEAEAKEDASAQPKVSPKWRQKQKRMHLRSRRHLQSGDRSKKRCICAAESISKVATEAKEDASAQPQSISKVATEAEEDASAQPKASSPPRQKQKKMHLRSRRHLQSGDRSKRGCICAAPKHLQRPKEAKEDASGQLKVSSKWRQKQKKMHLGSRRHLQSGGRSRRRCICAAESIFTSPTEAKEDASAQPQSIFTSPER